MWHVDIYLVVTQVSRTAVRTTRNSFCSPYIYIFTKYNPYAYTLRQETEHSGEDHLNPGVVIPFTSVEGPGLMREDVLARTHQLVNVVSWLKSVAFPIIAARTRKRII